MPLQEKIDAYRAEIKNAEPLLEEVYAWLKNELETTRIRFEGNKNLPRGVCSFACAERKTGILFIYNLDSKKVCVVVEYEGRNLLQEELNDESKEKLLTRLAQVWV